MIILKFLNTCIIYYMVMLRLSLPKKDGTDTTFRQ